MSEEGEGNPSSAQGSGTSPEAERNAQQESAPSLKAVTSPRKAQATIVSVQAFKEALNRVKGSPKDVEKYREIRMGNREFQWRVKKVDGAFDALLAAGFVLQTESPTSPSGNAQEGKPPREFLYWKAEGQIGAAFAINTDGLKECLQYLKQAQTEFEEKFSKLQVKSLDGRRYQKELRKEERQSCRFDIGFADAIGRRNTMEDDMAIIGRFMSRENIDYAAIFDGHGGDLVAELCAAKMHRLVARHVTMTDDVAQALRDAFDEMNSQCKSHPDMGATVVVALALEHRLWVANAGDARAVLAHKTEGAVRMSFDHKPDVPSEKARVQSLGGQVFTLFGCARVNGMLAVSRAIGDSAMHPFVSSDPFVNSIELNGDAQFLILACDGVWDVLSDSDAVDIVRKCSTPTKAAQQLVQSAFEKQSTDNISVIVIFFQPPEKW